MPDFISLLRDLIDAILGRKPTPPKPPTPPTPPVPVPPTPVPPTPVPPTPVPPTPVPPTPPAPVPPSFVTELLESHNSHRMREGTFSLKLHPLLNQAAQKHAEWMALHRRMSHTGKNGSSHSGRIRDTGYRPSYTAENVAAGYRSVEAVMNGWMGSRGHRRNILNSSLTECGFGMQDNYWCAVFASPNYSRAELVHIPMIESGPLQAD